MTHALRRNSGRVGNQSRRAALPHTREWLASQRAERVEQAIWTPSDPSGPELEEEAQSAS
jgi:hypothetical protein